MTKTELVKGSNGNNTKKKASIKNRKKKVSTSNVITTDVIKSSSQMKNGVVSDIKRMASPQHSSLTHTTSNTQPLQPLKPFMKGELIENLKHMMYGFGDEENVQEDVAALMEDYVVEYIHNMTKKAMEISSIKGKLDTECFIFLIRKEPERCEKIQDLLSANSELRKVLNSGFDLMDDKPY